MQRQQRSTIRRVNCKVPLLSYEGEPFFTEELRLLNERRATLEKRLLAKASSSSNKSPKSIPISKCLVNDFNDFLKIFFLIKKIFSYFSDHKRCLVPLNFDQLESATFKNLHSRGVQFEGRDDASSSEDEYQRHHNEDRYFFSMSSLWLSNVYFSTALTPHGRQLKRLLNTRCEVPLGATGGLSSPSRAKKPRNVSPKKDCANPLINKYFVFVFFHFVSLIQENLFSDRRNKKLLPKRQPPWQLHHRLSMSMTLFLVPLGVSLLRHEQRNRGTSRQKRTVQIRWSTSISFSFFFIFRFVNSRGSIFFFRSTKQEIITKASAALTIASSTVDVYDAFFGLRIRSPKIASATFNVYCEGLQKTRLSSLRPANVISPYRCQTNFSVLRVNGSQWG